MTILYFSCKRNFSCKPAAQILHLVPLVWQLVNMHLLTKHAALPVAKMGSPIIGEKFDKEVQEYMVALREVGTVVNTVVVRSAGTAVLHRRNPPLLASTSSDDGGVVLTKDCACYLLQRMGFIKRKATTKAKDTEENTDAVKMISYLRLR